MTSPTAVAQAQLDAYNAQDLDAHCAQFGEDVKVADLQRRRHRRRASPPTARATRRSSPTFPRTRPCSLGRIAVGNVVIDHERVFRTPSSEPFEVAAIYTITDGKIRRVDFVK